VELRKDYGTARVSERRAFRTRPWHRPVRERCSELSRTPLHWSRDSECCRGAPIGGDWDYPGLNGSRRGKLWFAGGCCHEVHVIGPNVSSKQGPPAARTNLLQAPQYQCPACRIQDVGLLAHSVFWSLFLAGVSRWQRGAISILSHRNGSSLAGEPSSVANKCNEVSRRFRRSLTVERQVAVLYWKSHRNMSTHYARKLSLLLTGSGAPIFTPGA
jgi:hypothetical protein